MVRRVCCGERASANESAPSVRVCILAGAYRAAAAADAAAAAASRREGPATRAPLSRVSTQPAPKPDTNCKTTRLSLVYWFLAPNCPLSLPPPLRPESQGRTRFATCLELAGVVESLRRVAQQQGAFSRASTSQDIAPHAPLGRHGRADWGRVGERKAHHPMGVSGGVQGGRHCVPSRSITSFKTMISVLGS